MTRKDVDTERVVQLYLQGKTTAEIAKIFDCTTWIVRNRLKKGGVYQKKPTPKKAEHGTRAMYVHHGCRCAACCRAEHQQYLKRADAKKRKRVYSKWSNERPSSSKWTRSESKRRSDKARREALMTRKRSLNRAIHWKDLYPKYDGKCAICGRDVNPDDWYYGAGGGLCFGRDYPTVDHIVSLKNGGDDTFSNTQLAHKHCNSVKGAK